MNKLFLICPDCHIEQAIRDWLGKNCYFLTALGTVFHFDQFELAEEVHQFVVCGGVRYIYIVNVLSCTFIKNIITGETMADTDAVKILSTIATNRKEDMDQLESPREKALLLAKTNILRQAYDISHGAFFSSKIESGEIILRGLIYDREEKQFLDVPIDLIR